MGFGNPSRVLFSFGGNTPGPTVRMRGNETLFVKVRNLLGEDLGQTTIGPAPDVAPGALPPWLYKKIQKEDDPYAPSGTLQHVKLKDDYCLGEHVNGLHAAHNTNLHTHGLHVRPYQNPDGTHSDNVILRIIPQADFAKREELAKTPACDFLENPMQANFLRPDEVVGAADFEFRLSDVEGDPNQDHPPGTFWYHPHCHGATHNQVASGMAGFLIVEGDVDDAINEALTDERHPNPETPAGSWDYRERLTLIQRVLSGNQSTDADGDNPRLRNPNAASSNGNVNPMTISMRPNAIELWRVLNGSVDGRGYTRFMVLKGQYAIDSNDNLLKLDSNKKWVRQSPAQVESDKVQLFQLSFDGITLMKKTRKRRKGKNVYVNDIKDLSKQNPGYKPLSNNPNPTPEEQLRAYVHQYENGETVLDAYVRPNEVYMAPANRADVFFKAPAEGVYTVLGHAVKTHADNPEQGLQKAVASGKPSVPDNVVIAYVAVRGKPCPRFDIASLNDELPPVPPYLAPIDEDELKVDNEYRSRTITYSGWGNADFPLVEVPATYAASNPKLRNVRFAAAKNEPNSPDVLLPANIRTMAIDGEKFVPDSPNRPTMVLDSAEEWCLYNDSETLWGWTGKKAEQPKLQFKSHYISYPIERSKGQEMFWKDHSFQIVTKGVDHPFHMHQNPFWVMRIEVPDATGELHNILQEPRWMDTVWIPRSRGRVVFRSRFPDFVGRFVDHCHLLLHEDNGMMQAVEVTPFESKGNYDPSPKVVNAKMSSADVSAIYPRATRDEAYQRSMQFVDRNMTSGQTYPGFKFPTPKLRS